MFGFLKKRVGALPEIPMLGLDNRQFLAAVLHSVEQSDAPSLCMWLIAKENIRAYEHAWIDAAQKQPHKGVPATNDGFIRWLASKVDDHTDELSKRRYQWFFLASILNRAGRVAQHSTELLDQLAAIWVFMARAGALLPSICKNNRLWSADEKVWFAGLTDERSGVDHVLNFMTPPSIRSAKAIHGLANQYNIFVSH